MTTKDIVDSKADKITGTKTLINTFGTKKAAMISFPFLFFPFLSIPFLVNSGVLVSYLLPLTIFVIPSFFVFYFMLKESESTRLENVHAWSLMYITFLFYAVGFVALTVFGEAGYLSFFS
jgi:4-hydroxybenzoate polyprenyltransferase